MEINAEIKYYVDNEYNYQNGRKKFCKVCNNCGYQKLNELLIQIIIANYSERL